MAFNEKYVTVTGGGLHDGSSEANAWTITEGFANAVAGDRLNVKAGTHSYSTNVVLASASATSPISLRGYTTSIGDLDTKPTTQLIDGTDTPIIQNTGGAYWYQTGGNFLFENIVFKSDVASRPAAYLDISESIIHRCKFLAHPSATIANTPALRTNGGYSTYSNCLISGEGCGQNQDLQGRNTFTQSVFSDLASIKSSQWCNITNSIITGMSSGGLTVSSYGWASIAGNTFYDISGDAITIGSSAPINGKVFVSNNIFHTVSGDAIKSSTNGKFDLFCDNNLFYNVTGNNYSNNLNLNRNELVDASDPFTDAAGGDYSLVSGSNGYNAAQPSLFEGLSIGSNRDIGAIQHQDLTLGGGSSSPTYTSTADTQIYPFRIFAEDDFDKGGTKFHPLS